MKVTMNTQAIPFMQRQASALRRALKTTRKRSSLVVGLTRHEVSVLFRESWLGAGWLAAQPLLSFSVYAFVFTVIFEPRWVEGQQPGDYVQRLFLGIVIYALFGQTISRAPGVIVSRPNLVKHAVFPIELLPLVAMGISLVYFAFGMMVVLVAATLMQQVLHATVLLLPIVMFPLLLLTLGLTWFLASLSVFIRDVQPGVQFIVHLLFFLTPVVWSIENVPPSVQPWLILHPIATVIESARSVVLVGELPDWKALAIATAIGGATTIAGYAWFMRTRDGFADVL